MSGRSVDIGMPAHGRPLYLAEAIDSILAQTHGEWQLVILDDPGGGETEEVVRPYLSDPRLSYRSTGRPVTPMAAMTTLLAAGEAPYFAFLHDDDRWGPDFLARRLAFLEEHQEAGLVFSGHVDIDGAGHITARHAPAFEEGVLPQAALFPEFCFRNLIDTMHSVVVRRSALEAVGARLDDDFPRVFDWELWLRIALRFPVAFVQAEDDVHYRVHGGQMSGSLGQADDFLRLFDRADAGLRDTAPDLRPPPQAARLHRAGLLLSVALDHAQAGERRPAAAALAAAVRAHPRSLLHRRFAAALLALPFGSAGERALRAARQAAYGRRRNR